MGYYYLHVKVIEVKEPCICPYVRLGINAKKLTTASPRTMHHMKRQWWEEQFFFRIKNLHSTITLELRDREENIVKTRHVGEIRFNINDFSDGKVHEQWWKTYDKRGKNREHHLHVAFHLTSSKDIRPFSAETALPVLSFEDWVKSGRPTSVKALGGGTDPVKKSESELVTLCSVLSQ